MKATKTTEIKHFTKEVPHLILTLNPSEVRELFREIVKNELHFNPSLVTSVTEFLSDYDSDKYDKYIPETICPPVKLKSK